MLIDEIRKALAPYIKPAFDAWKTGPTNHVVLVLQGSEDRVTIYTLSPVDTQVALATSNLESEMSAEIAVRVGQPPEDGKFWLVYILPTGMGLVTFRWREHVSHNWN